MSLVVCIFVFVRVRGRVRVVDSVCLCLSLYFCFYYFCLGIRLSFSLALPLFVVAFVALSLQSYFVFRVTATPDFLSYHMASCRVVSCLKEEYDKSLTFVFN